MARYSEKRRAALAAAMQDEVFHVASAILREEGFAGLTMERIAQEAGVSRATLYNYFADAEAVLAFVKARVVEPMTEAMESIADSDVVASDKLAAIVELIFDHINEDRALALALISKRELDGPRAALKLKTQMRFREIVQGIIATGIGEGQLRNIAPPVIAKLFLGAIGGLIETMFVSGEEYTSEEIVPLVMDVFLNGIQRTAGAPQATSVHPNTASPARRLR